MHRPILLALWLIAPTGCSLAHGDGVPPPTGDTSVFSAIDVLVTVGEYDYRDYAAREPGSRPPIRLGQGIHVIINGGTAEGRVHGLAVFADGRAVDEVGSAGHPQKFSYQYYPHYDGSEPARGAGTLLELRYEGASFYARVEPLTGEIASPAPEAALSAGEPLRVRWTGEIGAPDVTVHGPTAEGGGHCTVRYSTIAVGEDEVELAPERPMDDLPRNEPPCSGEVGATWGQPPEEVDSTPMRSFRLSRTLSRLQRFSIR